MLSDKTLNLKSHFIIQGETMTINKIQSSITAVVVSELQKAIKYGQVQDFIELFNLHRHIQYTLQTNI